MGDRGISPVPENRVIGRLVKTKSLPGSRSYQYDPAGRKDLRLGSGWVVLIIGRTGITIERDGKEVRTWPFHGIQQVEVGGVSVFHQMRIGWRNYFWNSVWFGMAHALFTIVYYFFDWPLRWIPLYSLVVFVLATVIVTLMVHMPFDLLLRILGIPGPLWSVTLMTVEGRQVSLLLDKKQMETALRLLETHRLMVRRDDYRESGLDRYWVAGRNFWKEYL